MHAINSLGEIRQLKEKNKIVSIYLSDGYAPTMNQWIFSAWKQINDDTGEFWHLCVPVEIDDDTRLNSGEVPKEFNVQLSQHIAKEYGIPDDSFPCIVFDNLRERDNQKYVSLGEYTEADRRRFFKGSAAIIKQDHSENRNISETINLISRREAFRPFANWQIAEKAFSLIQLAA